MLSAWNLSIKGPPLLCPFPRCVKIAAPLDVPARRLLDSILSNNSIFNVSVRIAHDRLSKILQAMAAVMGSHVRMPRLIPVIVDRVSQGHLHKVSTRRFSFRYNVQGNVAGGIPIVSLWHHSSRRAALRPDHLGSVSVSSSVSIKAILPGRRSSHACSLSMVGGPGYVSLYSNCTFTSPGGPVDLL